MNDNEKLEQQAALEQETQTSADEGEVLETTADEEVMDGVEGQEEAGTEEQTEQPKPDAEKESLKVQLQREKDARNGVKADKNLIANTLKWMMGEYGIDYDEAAKGAGISANDLKARVESPDTATNPFGAAASEFNDLYVNKGHKETLDDAYGVDTQQYVNAFDSIASQDPELIEQFISLPPAKRVAFVIKQGKALLEEVGGEKLSVRHLAKELAATRAELAELKGNKEDGQSVVQKRTNLPVTGAATTASKPSSTDAIDRRFGY